MPLFFFFNATATTEIYTLSLHDALPISSGTRPPSYTRQSVYASTAASIGDQHDAPAPNGIACTCSSVDRKSTRLNSSHSSISYAVFCLKKKNIHNNDPARRLTISDQPHY